MALYQRPLSVNLGGSYGGLVATLTYQVIDVDGADLIAETGAGLEEYPASSGNYRVAGGAAWDPNWTGSIIWRESVNGFLASEDFVGGVASAGPQPIASGYPDESDLQARLEAAGVTMTAALTARLAGAMAAGIRRFENAVGRIMLAGATAETRYFDPPQNGGVLYVDDLVEVTGIVYSPTNGTPETYTLNTDYWLEPSDSPEKGRPWTRLRLRGWWYGYNADAWLGSYHRAVQITGRWGYADAIPDDAREAMLDAAMLAIWGEASRSATGGLIEWERAGRRERYGPDFSRDLRLGIEASFKATTTFYKRLVF